MFYYKIVREDTVIAVATSDNLRKYQMKHGIFDYATPEEAEFLQIGDAFYHDSWMRDSVIRLGEDAEAQIEAISEEEYNLLVEVLSSDNPEEAVAQMYTEPEPEPEPEPADFAKSTVEVVRQNKLREVSLACQKAITDGFDVEWADGTKSHFSLTPQDQANLQSARLQLLGGDMYVIYHADGEEAREYSDTEMSCIINSADAHKTYHIVYHNSMKTWINALRRATTIAAVKYGDEIPQKYRSALFSQLLEQRNSAANK